MSDRIRMYRSTGRLFMSSANWGMVTRAKLTGNVPWAPVHMSAGAPAAACAAATHAVSAT
eukprot:CAMPEP_0202381426 /NCGR_PEP_ID=MMETSP1127-20130417/35569_1 /ASSEMBLY_ACC=CAM_ASM_000462 /TAXON_ID=3047 /ORGANISM="Dunaliella tertiolecta, Strain CCMP1320" /LENGTH=59 /DNA_ID=CAMNT_0048980377 /DNA_START=42 /DNA_END=217 /DNA_ORIENTATION=-